MYYNIHAHKADLHPEYWTLITTMPPFEELGEQQYYSAGLHPWYLKNDRLEEHKKQLRSIAHSQQIVAIGECGLDRVCETDWSLQQKAFQFQIGLSNEVKKPLIVHAVRAHQDVMQMLRKFHHQQPVIFHGVNHKAIESLWRAGHFVSFGKALLNTQTEAAKAFLTVLGDSYFLETDDADISITEIYEAAAALKKVPLSIIIDQVEQNFRSIFAT